MVCRKVLTRDRLVLSLGVVRKACNNAAGRKSTVSAIAGRQDWRGRLQCLITVFLIKIVVAMLGNQKMAAVLSMGLFTQTSEDVQIKGLLGLDKYVDGIGVAKR